MRGDPTPGDVLAARDARGARSEQDVSPPRIAVFTVVIVTVAWVWLGPVWAVVAAVFVVPPWLIVTIQARVSRYRRITPEQQTAIRRVRLWDDPLARLGALFVALLISCTWVAVVAQEQGAPEWAVRLVMLVPLVLLKPIAQRLQRHAAAGHRLFARSTDPPEHDPPT